MAAQVDFPEIDLRQRLTVSRGYGVTEIYIPEGSDHVGKALQDSDLLAKDLTVLSLHRHGKVIPNPKLTRILEHGDRLLCFGKLEEMRDLVPPKEQKRRRPKISKLPKSESPKSTAK
jgi:ribosomal protein S6--L-glutamate ligase